MSNRSATVSTFLAQQHDQLVARDVLLFVRFSFVVSHFRHSRLIQNEIHERFVEAHHFSANPSASEYPPRSHGRFSWEPDKT